MKRKFLNSEGQEIQLTENEKFHNSYLERQLKERFANDLGAEIDITSLTSIVKQVSEQKFFEIAPADYMPIRVGEGAWSTNLTTYRSFSNGGDFAEGIINTGSNSGRLASTDSTVDSVTVPVKQWAKSIDWTIAELNFASKSGNWDIVASKEESRKKNWDLGIQEVSFFGLQGVAGIYGLLNQQGVTTNTTVIVKPISLMTPTELKAFQKDIVTAYRINNNRTAWPNRLVIPESDFLGLVSQSSPDFPIKSTLELLEESFQKVCGKDFRILPLAYADVSVGMGGITQQTYCLYKYDEKSLRMDLPVDYTNTLANSINNFQFQNVGYGQFTGLNQYRPLEFMYFKYTPA
jgi:hypothetical protein